MNNHLPHQPHTLFSAAPPILLRIALFAIIFIGTAPLAGCEGSISSSMTEADATPLSAGPNPEALATLGASVALESQAIRCGEKNLSALRTIWEQYPGDPQVREALRSDLEKCQQWDGLAEVLEAQPAEERTNAEQLNLAGLYLRNLGRFADAEAVAVPLAERFPDDTDIVSLAAASLYYQDRVEEAIPMIDRLWEQLVASQNTDILTMRAVAFMNDGQPKRAVSILEQVIQFNPRHTFGWTSLARARQAMGDEEGAREAREVNEALRSESSLMARQGQRMADITRNLQASWDAEAYEEVVRLAESLLEMAPEDKKPEIHRTIGKAYNEMARPADARTAFEAAAEIERLLNAEGDG